MLVYTVAGPKVGENFTEFYILGQDGKASGYPRELKIGEVGEVIVGIINHEHQDVNYHMQIWSAGILIKEQGPVMSRHEQKWEQKVSFILTKIGQSQKVEFLLFKEGQAEPYISLHLWLDVR